MQLAALEQPRRQLLADEPAAAGDQHAHDHDLPVARCRDALSDRGWVGQPETRAGHGCGRHRGSWINARVATMDPAHGSAYGALEGQARPGRGREDRRRSCRWRTGGPSRARRWSTSPAAGSRRGWSTATPIWSGAATGRTSSSGGWPGASYAEIAAAGGGIRSTGRGDAGGLGGGAGPGGGRAAGAAAGRGADHGRDQVGLRAEPGGRAEAAARRPPGGRAGAGARDHHAAGRCTPCRRSSTAAPTTMSPTPARRSCPLPRRRGWPTRSTCSASISPSRRPSASACSSGRASSGCRSRVTWSSSRTWAAARSPPRYGALSVDHIEYLDEAGRRRDRGCRARPPCCCPGAFYFLREKQAPPVAALRRAGVPMAVATDLNPGTSPFASLRLMANMACILFGLTVEEALAGITRDGARALGMARPARRAGAGHGRRLRRLVGALTPTRWSTSRWHRGSGSGCWAVRSCRERRRQDHDRQPTVQPRRARPARAGAHLQELAHRGRLPHGAEQSRPGGGRASRRRSWSMAASAGPPATGSASTASSRCCSGSRTTRRCWSSRASPSACSRPTPTRRACCSPTPTWCRTGRPGSISTSSIARA